MYHFSDISFKRLNGGTNNSESDSQRSLDPRAPHPQNSLRFVESARVEKAGSFVHKEAIDAIDISAERD